MTVYVNPGGVFDMNVKYFSGVSEYYYPLNTPDLYGLLSQILLSVTPGNGLPTDIVIEDNALRLSLSDSNDCVELIRRALLPLLQNEVYRYRLLRSVKENNQMSDMYEVIEEYIKSFKGMLDSTVDMKLGIKATKISDKNQDYLYETWNKYSNFRVHDL